MHYHYYITLHDLKETPDTGSRLQCASRPRVCAQVIPLQVEPAAYERVPTPPPPHNSQGELDGVDTAHLQLLRARRLCRLCHMLMVLAPPTPPRRSVLCLVRLDILGRLCTEGMRGSRSVRQGGGEELWSDIRDILPYTPEYILADRPAQKKKCEETSARPKRLMGGVCWEGLEGCASHLEDVCANLGCIVELPVALDDGRRSDCCLDPRARRCTQLGQGLPGA